MGRDVLISGLFKVGLPLSLDVKVAVNLKVQTSQEGKNRNL